MNPVFSKEGNLSLFYTLGGDGRKYQISFYCDKNMLDPYKLYYISENPPLQYNFGFRSKYSCPTYVATTSPPNNSSSLWDALIGYGTRTQLWELILTLASFVVILFCLFLFTCICCACLLFKKGDKNEIKIEKKNNNVDQEKKNNPFDNDINETTKKEEEKRQSLLSANNNKNPFGQDVNEVRKQEEKRLSSSVNNDQVLPKDEKKREITDNNENTPLLNK